MAKIEYETRYIASVFPGRLESIRRPFGLDPAAKRAQSTVYTIPPVPRGDPPFVLTVTDGYYSRVIDGGFGVENHPVLESVDVIVRDLMNHWTGRILGLSEGAGIGVGLIAGPRPTASEIDRLVTMQTKAFEQLLHMGTELANKKEWSSITEYMRIAAQWLDAPVSWAAGAQVRKLIPCPACTTLIPDAAYVCPTCHTRIREFPSTLAGRTESKSAA